MSAISNRKTNGTARDRPAGRLKSITLVIDSIALVLGETRSPIHSFKYTLFETPREFWLRIGLESMKGVRVVAMPELREPVGY